MKSVHSTGGEAFNSRCHLSIKTAADVLPESVYYGFMVFTQTFLVIKRIFHMDCLVYVITKCLFSWALGVNFFFVLLSNLRQNRFSVWTVLVVREPQMSFELDVGYKLFFTFFTDKLFITYMLTDVASQSFQLFVCLRAPLTPGEK